MSVDDYARKKRFPHDNAIDEAKKDPFQLLGLNLGPVIDVKRPLMTQLTDIPINNLIQTAQWHLFEFLRSLGRSDRARALMKVAEFVDESVLPDLDRLDKLMRYQTTVNRQLSTAIGELLAMTKTL